MDAFALQKPTITSTAAVLGEYARRGFSVGVTFPSRAEGLAIQIENVLRNPSKYKPKRFEMLSWTDVANRTIAVYNKALNE